MFSAGGLATFVQQSASVAIVGVMGLLLLSGCFAELLPASAGTRLAFTCAMLDPQRASVAVLQSYVGEDVHLDISVAITALRDELTILSGRDAADLGAVQRTGPAVPADGWNATTVAAWGASQPFQSGNRVLMRILWVDRLDDDRLSGVAPVAGTIALSQHAILAGAARLAADPSVVARAVLLHFAGHALGVVNQGVPVQDPDIQEREGPASHDPDPTSVLHAAWEDPRTMAWSAGAAYDRYPDDLHRDWAAAKAPGGVCQ